MTPHHHAPHAPYATVPLHKSNPHTSPGQTWGWRWQRSIKSGSKINKQTSFCLALCENVSCGCIKTKREMGHLRGRERGQQKIIAKYLTNQRGLRGWGLGAGSWMVFWMASGWQRLTFGSLKATTASALHLKHGNGQWP